jgi:hypothetical protein
MPVGTVETRFISDLIDTLEASFNIDLSIAMRRFATPQHSHTSAYFRAAFGSV